VKDLAEQLRPMVAEMVRQEMAEVESKLLAVTGSQLADVAERQNRVLHLFDTFGGMPISGPGDSHAVGDFGDTSEAAVRALIPSATFHVGTFPATCPAVLPPSAFAHIDADQYQSYIDAIDRFGPRMVPGGVMWFDDCGILPSADAAVIERFGERVDRTSFSKWIVRF
jgi:hypothetical protein